MTKLCGLAQEEGVTALEARDGARLLLKRVPGRGWRCCRIGQAPEECVPLYASLRGALIDSLPGLDQDEEWLAEVVRLLAPEEAAS